MTSFDIFTGGLAETNGIILHGADSVAVIDAPEGMAQFLGKLDKPVSLLILTHGHWDHLWDAAAIVERWQCPVYYHADDTMLFTNPNIMRSFGLPVELQPVKADRLLAAGDHVEFSPWSFNVFHIPGHCPGSICLYEATAGVVFAGDTLFAGAVGRWDLPGGDRSLLLDGIRRDLLSLPDDTRVVPGHGPETSVGLEKQTNPFF